MAAQLQCRSKQLEQGKNLHKEILVDKNKFFGVDDQARTSVELYARALDITWGSNPEYWTYISEMIPNTDYTVEVAKLRNVCWLEVKGQFDTRKLTVGVQYEILFDTELTHGAQGWSCPVSFEHRSQFGISWMEDMKLDHLIGKGRVQKSVGKFRLSSIPKVGTPNETFRMHETRGGQWKNGLIMRGVIIKPCK